MKRKKGTDFYKSKITIALSIDWFRFEIRHNPSVSSRQKIQTTIRRVTAASMPLVHHNNKVHNWSKKNASYQINYISSTYTSLLILSSKPNLTAIRRRNKLTNKKPWLMLQKDHYHYLEHYPKSTLNATGRKKTRRISPKSNIQEASQIKTGYERSISRLHLPYSPTKIIRHQQTQ